MVKSTYLKTTKRRTCISNRWTAAIHSRKTRRLILTSSNWSHIWLPRHSPSFIPRRRTRLQTTCWLALARRRASDQTLRVKRRTRIGSERRRRSSGKGLYRFSPNKSCQFGGHWISRWQSTTNCLSTDRTWSRKPDSLTSKTKNWRLYLTNTCSLAWTKSCKCLQLKWLVSILDDR